MSIILIIIMNFRINLTEESVWVTFAFSSLQLYVWKHRQISEHI